MGLERITVFGLGRVGLIMAVCLAKHGYEVVGFDVDSNLVERLQNGETPFYEPNLSEYLASALQKKRFAATTDPSINSRSDLAYISVGTPSLADGAIDLSYVEEAAKTIGRTLHDSRQHQLVVVKSTVTPGTARNLIKPAVERESKRSAGTDFAVCSNPEFLREGNAIHDTEFPDRIVIGSDDPAAIEKLENIYRQFHGAQFPPIIRTTFENAELTKYTNNAFLATKVSFINCIAGIAERIPHADIKAVAEGIGLDERIGSKFLNAGLGWGGSCFPKDLSALVSLSKKIGYDAELIAATVSTNRKQPRKAVELAKKALGSLAEKQIAVLGLSFKPETDDMRDAVSIPIINGLLTEGAKVTVWDPEAMVEARRIFGDRIRYATGALECLEQADCCILATEWAQFKKLRPKTFLEEMRHPVVIDGRRLYDPSEFKNAGIGFHAIGLGPA